MLSLSRCAVIAAALLFVGGCASRTTHGRLYSLDRPERAELLLRFSGQRNGSAMATLPSGERLNGEFVIWTTRSGAIDPMAWQEVGGRVKGLREGSNEWPVVYGYASNAEKAEPVGTAMLIGDAGTSLEIVLYHAVDDPALVGDGLIGDGLARDNKGNWYRVLLGNLE
jgi:hypothetical protein